MTREPFEQVGRVEPDRDVRAVDRGFERLRCLGLVAAAGLEQQLALGERQAYGGVALGNDATRLTESTNAWVST